MSAGLHEVEYAVHPPHLLLEGGADGRHVLLDQVVLRQQARLHNQHLYTLHLTSMLVTLLTGVRICTLLTYVDSDLEL